LTTEEILKEITTQVHRTALILHKMPKEVMALSRDEMEDLWTEYLDMTMEMTVGRKRPKLYEYEREALNNLKERFDGRS
jgi:hypothetical protein